jgi:multidrug resistance efflux pump
LAERDIDLLNREIQSSRVELAEAQANLREVELLKQQEAEKQEYYRAISQTQLNSTQAQVAAETAQYQIEKDNLSRFAELLSKGAVSQQDLTPLDLSLLMQKLSFEKPNQNMKWLKFQSLLLREEIFMTVIG